MATCGTDTGYKAHRAAGEEACDPCKTAHAVYEYGSKTRRAYQRAFQRALRLLAKEHADEFAALLAQERAKQTVSA